MRSTGNAADFSLTAVIARPVEGAVHLVSMLWLADQVLPLGIAAILLGGAPGGGVYVYLCWSILSRSVAPNPGA